VSPAPLGSCAEPARWRARGRPRLAWLSGGLLGPLLAAGALAASLGVASWAGPASAAAPATSDPAGAPRAASPPGGVAGALREADKAFEFQEFDRVIGILAPLAEAPDRVPDVDQRVRVLERLGAAYWFVGTSGKAQLAFSRLLKLRPDHELDKLVYPPSLIAFFNDQRARLRKLGFIGPKPRDDGGQAPPSTVLRVREVTRREVSWPTYLVPFGYGQFVNGDDTAGSILLGLQVLGLAGNVATYFGVQALQDGHGQVAPRDRGQVELLQGLWIGATAIFGAAYATSVIHGYLRRRPAEEVREFDLPGEPGAEPGAAPDAVRLQLVPSARGVGLALDGRF